MNSESQTLSEFYESFTYGEPSEWREGIYAKPKICKLAGINVHGKYNCGFIGSNRLWVRWFYIFSDANQVVERVLVIYEPSNKKLIDALTVVRQHLKEPNLEKYDRMVIITNDKFSSHPTDKDELKKFTQLLNQNEEFSNQVFEVIKLDKKL